MLLFRKRTLFNSTNPVFNICRVNAISKLR
jgi:hypothetical protein